MPKGIFPKYVFLATKQKITMCLLRCFFLIFERFFLQRLAHLVYMMLWVTQITLLWTNQHYICVKLCVHFFIY